MKKKYLAPTIKAYQINATAILAGSFNSDSVKNGGDDSGNGTSEAKGFSEEW